MCVVDIVNLIFLFLYVIEMAIKIVAMGGHFWRDPWCRFDFAVVVIVVAAKIVVFGIAGRTALLTLTINESK